MLKVNDKSFDGSDNGKNHNHITPLLNHLHIKTSVSKDCSTSKMLLHVWVNHESAGKSQSVDCLKERRRTLGFHT